MEEEKLQRKSIPLYYNKIEPVKPVNDEFTLVKIRSFASGCNRNYSYISKDELDKALPTMAYIPVVGHLIEDKDKDGNVTGYRFGGHDATLDKNLHMVPLTVPFGVVTTDTPFYETVHEYNQDVDYVINYAILWTGRYPALKEAIYSDDVWFGESAEITYSQFRPYEKDSNYTELLGVSFSALCILGKSDDASKNVEPCFISADVEPVNFELQSEKFNLMMDELKGQLAACFNNDFTKGGNMNLDNDKIESIFAEYEGVTRDSIDFEISDTTTEEQLRAAIEEYVAKNAKPDKDDKDKDTTTADEPGDTDTDDKNEDEACGKKKTCSLGESFSATMNQKREALSNALDPIIARNSNGEVISEVYFYVMDLDDEYVYVERDSYESGDRDCKYGRFPYSFDNTAKTASITGSFEEMVVRWLTLSESAKLDADRDELESLRKFKLDAEDAAHKAEVDSVLEAFSDLAEVEGYDKIAEDAYSYKSVDDLKLNLFALRGMNIKPAKKETPAPHSVTVPIDNEPTVSGADYYGGLFEKFGYVKQK
jgi:hypothetical protein